MIGFAVWATQRRKKSRLANRAARLSYDCIFEKIYFAKKKGGKTAFFSLLKSAVYADGFVIIRARYAHNNEAGFSINAANFEGISKG